MPIRDGLYFLLGYNSRKAVGPVAQWIEQYRPKVTVEGSSPFRIAT